MRRADAVDERVTQQVLRLGLDAVVSRESVSPAFEFDLRVFFVVCAIDRPFSAFRGAMCSEGFS